MNWNKNQLLKMKRNIHLAVVSLPDTDAVETPELFPTWEVGHQYKIDDRFQWDGKLYKVRQAHTSQENWSPDATPSLYAEVPKPGSGQTPEDPIPYSGNMALEAGKYYSQSGVVYICTRDTVNPVYADLAALVGHYVEVWEG